MASDNIGYPDASGTYNYPIKDGKILLIPNTLNMSDVKINKSTKNIKKQSNIMSIVQNIIIFIIIVGILIAMYNIYNRVKFIETNFNSSVNNIVNQNTTTSFNNMFNSQIDNKTSTIYNNILNKINGEIVPKIYSDASNAFLPNGTSAINITGDFPMISKNTLVCDDIYNIGTCTCLFDNCVQLSTFKNFLFVDRPIGFNDINGYVYSGNVVPVSVDTNNIRINNRFCLTFYMNITKTIPENRIIFHWGGDNNYLNRYPSIILRGNSDNDYGGRYRNSLELRFSNLGNDGVFNVTSDVRDNCLDNIPLYQWNHIGIMADKKTISFYLNGKLVKTTITQQDIKIGDPDQWIFIGNPFNNQNEKNPFGVLLAKMRWFPDLIPLDYFGFFAHEFIRK
jgi:hypothetical protein